MNIIPFRGYRYNLKKVGALDDVICPPYDQFRPGLDDLLYARHPFNLARIIMNKIEAGDTESFNRYTRSKALLDDWIQQGVFVQDSKPSLYPYYQDFQLPGHPAKTRKGFIALGEVTDYSERVVLPHEKTLSKPKEDRLRLMRSTLADTGLVFMLYSDPEGVIESLLDGAISTDPDLEALDLNQENNRLWRMDDCEKMAQVMQALRGKTVIIADGHHRYEVARLFREETRSLAETNHAWELYRYKLMSFVRLESEGITIFPIHRLVHSLAQFNEAEMLGQLSEFFEVCPFPSSSIEKSLCADQLIQSMLAEQKLGSNCFGLYLPSNGSFYQLKFKALQASQLVWPAEKSPAWRQLDVSILQEVILSKVLGIGEKELAEQSNLEYVSFHQEALRNAEGGKYQALFLLNPTPIEKVKAVVEAGDLLPQKSTHFHPKLMEGFVFAKHL
jgi:uncharacterized protein (DUF1015 family)